MGTIAAASGRSTVRARASDRVGPPLSKRPLKIRVRVASNALRSLGLKIKGPEGKDKNVFRLSKRLPYEAAKLLRALGLKFEAFKKFGLLESRHYVVIR
jgi:hypothetical protein